MRAVAQAHANIALIKYWGKRGPGNLPATPSIGLCLEALTTTTCVLSIKSNKDTITINGRNARGDARQRVVDYLDLWRGEGLVEGRFSVESMNNFPTASGLASSSSGFAALAMALSAFSVHKLTTGQISRLARLGSGSAARSIPGGIACLPTGSDPAASLLLKPEQAQLAMAICVVDAPGKETSSRAGMTLCAETSAYWKQWLKQGALDYKQARTILAEHTKPDHKVWEVKQFHMLGECVERNCCAMHACMLAARPPLIYWTPATIAVMQAVRSMRTAKLPVYFTIDAGPHVALVCRPCDLERVSRWATRIPGVVQVISSRAGGPARVIETA